MSNFDKKKAYKITSEGVDKHVFTAKCPGCEHEYNFTGKQARLEETVTCPGCERDIHLRQPDGHLQELYDKGH